LLLELRRHLLGRGQMLVLESVPPRLRELAVLYGVDALLAT
jgi:ABC-type transporter Mla MlaB component